MIGKPSDHHKVAAAMAGMTSAGSERNGIGARPAACSPSAIRPASGVRMKRQISVTIVTDSTSDEKYTPRSTAANLVVRLSASASSSAIAVSGGTISRVKVSVLAKA